MIDRLRAQAAVKSVTRLFGLEIRYAFQNLPIYSPMIYGRWVRPADARCIFDVGANIGQSAKAFAKAFPNADTIFELCAGDCELMKSCRKRRWRFIADARARSDTAFCYATVCAGIPLPLNELQPPATYFPIAPKADAGSGNFVHKSQTGLILEIDVSKLAVVVAHHKATGLFCDGPGHRLAQLSNALSPRDLCRCVVKIARSRDWMMWIFLLSFPSFC